ncbi:DNA-binding IclR family transcriptional regulator [Allocatelliglobosispora scoriae]|uniref:DNA-binding IclR family transcriptional regulator n=1 Tax=Allocatelliglobosispora scoriae TaxID=643052 RepID=A0A841BJ86_9ACTN|nr:helix-turn-helix domain-containing protein [Allocatelliglobosispora scoriae]MBB5866842.1 DNA-binding IclR family transcriptional regulator [Allocatelliglobosispora scoriae]
MTRRATPDEPDTPSIVGPRKPEKATSTFLQRIVAVLETIAAQRHGMSLSAIARSTSLAPSTAHRLLGDLAALQMVELTPSGYVLGERARFLAASIVEPLAGVTRQAIVPHLVRLHRSTGLVVTLGVPDAGHVLVSDVIFSPGQERLARAYGEVLSISTTALGLILLAYHPQLGADRSGVPPPRRAVRQPVPDVRQVLTAGSACLPRTDLPGCVECAVTISGRGSRPIGAISLSWQTANPDPLWIEELRRAAFAATTALRHELRPPR